MRIRTRLALLSIVMTVAVSCFSSWGLARSTSRIEAIRGKKYRISKQHGPWMIMVATFRPVHEADRTEGMSPEEAADELVFELRSKGIPAYAVSQQKILAQVNSHGRIPGQVRQASYIAQQAGITVLAGNYDSLENKKAQKTLNHVKKLHPKFMSEVEKNGRFVNTLKNGGIYRKTPGRPGPLSGAFLTINPILTPEEARKKKGSPLLMQLNSGSEYSLLENPGMYSLIVASFYGNSVTLNRGSRLQTVSGNSISMEQKSRLRDIKKNFKITDSLDKAALDAWELAKTLRETRNIKAYVWHDQYRSVVTIGEFQSPHDPRIAEMAKRYGAKTKQHPITKQSVLTAEAVTIPPKIQPGTDPVKQWILDPKPKMIKIPNL